MEDNKILQVEMHKDFFDRCKFAIENKFYMEAILMEYAAIESRLEVMLGIFGAPCNKFADDNVRRKINISHRIACLKYLMKNSSAFDNSKLNKKFFEDFEKWISERNRYIHGLYKNEIIYKQRMKNSKNMAEKGYEYCRLMYNEVNRIKRLKKKHCKDFDFITACHSHECTFRT